MKIPFFSSSTAAAEAQLRAALDKVIDPLIGRSLVAANAVAGASIRNKTAQVAIELGFPAAGHRDTLIAATKQAIREHAGLDADVTVTWKIAGRVAQKGLQALPGIRNVIAVASGKGGVGKSTVTANLALALQAEGAKVGILDADIYGPTQPRLLGTKDGPTSLDGKIMEPIRAHGLQAMSIGFLIDEEQPMIWRGPMVTQALTRLLTETRWDDLDYLVVDLPPGTGDIHLTLSQRIPLSGAIVVTTPQEVALLAARKGLRMFQKVEVPVLGVIENMSHYECPHCGHHDPVFGEGGGERMAQQYGVELLGRIPLNSRIRAQSDAGTPTVAAEPDSDLARLYRDLARRAAARLAYGVSAPMLPTIEIVDD